MSKEHSEWLASLPPAEREALNKGLSALETMADLWAVEINLGKMSETIAGAPDHAKRAFAIKSLVEQGYIEGAYCTYLDYKNGKLPGQSARPEALPITLKDVLINFSQGSCPACGWHLEAGQDNGCAPFNCSYRPTEGTREHERWLRRAKGMQEVLEWATATASVPSPRGTK